MKNLNTQPSARHGLMRFALRHPKLVTWLMILSTSVFVVLAAVPSLFPAQVPFLHGLQVDTDPENMLAADAPVRQFHTAMKRQFSLNDIVVVGIENTENPNGVFNPESLRRIYDLANFAKTLTWPAPETESSDQTQTTAERMGVVSVDIIAPNMVDKISQAGLGAVSFSWLMPQPPQTVAEAKAIRQAAARLPMLDGTMLAHDGKAISLYLPITDKALAYRVREEILDFTADWQQGGDRVLITGLPVAEDVFGVEMFIQMAISAPAAMLVIFALLYWFFRNIRIITAPMIVAMVCSMATMGALIATGHTVHIMSSMIPIFIMPIAVLDAVHILSEFFDRYQKTGDRKATLVAVVDELFAPMLFTTLTTAAGFASLALTPIPPVQVFGVFVAFGVVLAWLWTITFIPAYISMISDEKLRHFGLPHGNEDHAHKGVLPALGRAVRQRYGAVLVGTVLLSAAAAWGISKIVINDNPMKWFEEQHPIRMADKILNTHFAGTYMAYLALQDTGTAWQEGFAKALEAASIAAEKNGDTDVPAISAQIKAAVLQYQEKHFARDAVRAAMPALEAAQDVSSDAAYNTWAVLLTAVDDYVQSTRTFQQPETLQYMESLQAHMQALPQVGKTMSVAELVKTVHRDLYLGEDSAYKIPATSKAVGQTLVTFQNSHRPHDLWHYVTPDYRSANIMVQLTSGDNKDMSAVVAAVHDFIAQHPLPEHIHAQWFGLTYINVAWQEEMVTGMLEAFAGSFVVVLVMMIALFRSVIWGALSMIPLTFSVGLIYGVTGIVGKDYDMPVAVLSALSLGLAVDYAIHFLARSRALLQNGHSWDQVMRMMYGEPARAISRNAIVLGLGFAPLLVAPLVPYQTVGVLIAAILITAGAATLIILPAMMTILGSWLAPEKRCRASTASKQGKSG
jgi:predicted RND superfamily exporter protein